METETIVEQPVPMAPNRKCETGCGRPADKGLYISELDMAFCIKHEDLHEGFSLWVFQTKYKFQMELQ